MKLIYCLMILLWPFVSMAQTIKPLNIGDTVPDIEITNVYNYPTSTIHLSDLKGKLVILDFWSTWCGACIEAFPKMHHLQKEFGDRLQVILVNTYEGDTIQRVKPFFEKRKARTGQEVTLPYSLLQSSLAEYFPYKFIPHYVWIDKRGKVIATTSKDEVNEKNILAVVEGTNLLLHAKKDLLEFDRKKPLFENEGLSHKILSGSFFTSFIEGIGTAMGVDRATNDKFTRLYVFNHSPLSLLRVAYPAEMSRSPNRILIETAQKKMFDDSANSSISKYTNSYCYELTVSPSTMEGMLTYFQEDLSRLFHVKVKSEVRMMKCWILKRGKSIEKAYSKNSVQLMDIDENSLHPHLQNQPVSVLVEILNSLPAMREHPIIDESGITYNLDIQFPGNFYNLPSINLKSFLQKKGFTVSEENRNIKVSVISGN